jgi:N-acetylmuramoyl-L-alanine amidase
MAGLRIWLCGRTIAASLSALLLLPIAASQAGFLSDLFKGSSKSNSSPKSAVAPKHSTASKHAVSAEPAAPSKHVVSDAQDAASKSNPAKESRPAKSAAQPVDPAKFRIVVDVGHTVESEGALSARNVPEFEFNLRLARKIVDRLKSEGFVQAKLLVTTGKARPSLATRVNAANNLRADLFLSIHHDSVPDKMMEKWEFEGKKSYYSDRFSGYGLFVSKSNPDFDDSMRFAKLIGTQLRAEGIKFADQYTLPVMGKYRHDLLDRDAGVYRYDHLIVLMKTQMPAVLLEAGSIINRDEELQMASDQRQDMTVQAVTTAVKEYCGLPVTPAPALAAASAPKADAQPVPDAEAKADH